MPYILFTQWKSKILSFDKKSQNIFFCGLQKKVMQFWNNMGASKWWQNYYYFFFSLYAALLYTLIALVLILCVISSYVFLKPLIFSPIKSENQLTCITLVFETIKCLTPLTIICTIIISISRAKFPLSSDGLLSAGVGSRLPLLWCPIETFRQLLFSHFPKAQRNVPPSFMGNFESASLPIEEVPNFTFGRPSSSEMPPKHSGGVLPSCQL